jgi:outer membrane protein TolC
MLDTEWNAVVPHAIDLYPADLQTQIDGTIDAIYQPINNGVYRAGFATQQAAYDEAVAQLQGGVRRALREVETALVALDATAARERDVMAAATDFEASLTATEARQRGGLASLLDLEAARRNALLARSTVIELQRERTTAWIALYRSLGGGWTPAEAVPAALTPQHPTPSTRP